MEKGSKYLGRLVKMDKQTNKRMKRNKCLEIISNKVGTRKNWFTKGQVNDKYGVADINSVCTAMCRVRSDKNTTDWTK